MAKHYILSIDLPPPIKKHLATLCFGLPNVEWTSEENFNLTLQNLNHVNDTTLYEIKDRLETIHFEPFQISLCGVDFSSSRGSQGVLWIGITPSDPVVKLNLKIDKALADVHHKSIEKSSNPLIILGKDTHIQPNRLVDFLQTHSLFRSQSFDVSSFSLKEVITTPNKILFKELGKYPPTINDK